MNKPPRTHYLSIGQLFEAGMKFSSVIDVGCGDGQFSVILSEAGPFRGCTLLNIDAQDDYRESLTEVQATLGGHFRICAVGERDGGKIELQRGAHAYWGSLRPPADRYWEGLNEMRQAEPILVPLRSIDALVKETALPAPHVIKMDIQGAEATALAGATRTLADTAAIAIEVLVDDFGDIHDLLSAAGMVLFEVTDLSYGHSGFLGWFYAVYVKAEHSALRPISMVDPSQSEQVLASQFERRAKVREMIAESLRRYRAGAWPKFDAG